MSLHLDAAVSRVRTLQNMYSSKTFELEQTRARHAALNTQADALTRRLQALAASASDIARRNNAAVRGLHSTARMNEELDLVVSTAECELGRIGADVKYLRESCTTQRRLLMDFVIGQAQLSHNLRYSCNAAETRKSIGVLRGRIDVARAALAAAESSISRLRAVEVPVVAKGRLAAADAQRKILVARLAEEDALLSAARGEANTVRAKAADLSRAIEVQTAAVTQKRNTVYQLQAAAEALQRELSETEARLGGRKRAAVTGSTELPSKKVQSNGNRRIRSPGKPPDPGNEA